LTITTLLLLLLPLLLQSYWHWVTVPRRAELIRYLHTGHINSQQWQHSTTFNHRVSKKTAKIVFPRTSSNIHQLW